MEILIPQKSQLLGIVNAFSELYFYSAFVANINTSNLKILTENFKLLKINILIFLKNEGSSF